MEELEETTSSSPLETKADLLLMGILAGKLSSPDFLDKRGVDNSCVQASS